MRIIQTSPSTLPSSMSNNSSSSTKIFNNNKIKYNFRINILRINSSTTSVNSLTMQQSSSRIMPYPLSKNKDYHQHNNRVCFTFSHLQCHHLNHHYRHKPKQKSNHNSQNYYHHLSTIAMDAGYLKSLYKISYKSMHVIVDIAKISH